MIVKVKNNDQLYPKIIKVITPNASKVFKIK